MEWNETRCSMGFVMRETCQRNAIAYRCQLFKSLSLDRLTNYPLKYNKIRDARQALLHLREWDEGGRQVGRGNWELKWSENFNMVWFPGWYWTKRGVTDYDIPSEEMSARMLYIEYMKYHLKNWKRVLPFEIWKINTDASSKIKLIHYFFNVEIFPS